MPTLLTHLRGVPEDEIEEILELLQAHAIEHYLTPPGNWGISAGGIWLVDEQRRSEALALYAAYQRQRAQRARDEYRQARADGRAPGFWRRFRAQPLIMLVQLAGLLFLLALSTLPFVWLMRG